MSPVTKRLIQSRYCCRSGRSRPSSRSRWATARGSASGPRIARATSPGRSCPPAKTSTLSSHSVMSASAARRASSVPTVTASVVAVRGGGHGLRLLDAVDEDTIDELVVKAHESLDARGLLHRLRVVPHHVLMALAVDRQVIVVGTAFVRATRYVAARREEVEPAIADRQIVARRHPRLEQKGRAP